MHTREIAGIGVISSLVGSKIRILGQNLHATCLQMSCYDDVLFSSQEELILSFIKSYTPYQKAQYKHINCRNSRGLGTLHALNEPQLRLLRPSTHGRKDAVDLVACSATTTVSAIVHACSLRSFEKNYTSSPSGGVFGTKHTFAV